MRQLLSLATRQHYCLCVLHTKYCMLHSTNHLEINVYSILNWTELMILFSFGYIPQCTFYYQLTCILCACLAITLLWQSQSVVSSVGVKYDLRLGFVPWTTLPLKRSLSVVRSNKCSISALFIKLMPFITSVWWECWLCSWFGFQEHSLITFPSFSHVVPIISHE